MSARVPETPLRIVAVIPAYNVAATIADVLTQIPPVVTDVIVVDDASKDETAAITRSTSSSDIVGNNGNVQISRASRSAAGRLPSASGP